MLHTLALVIAWIAAVAILLAELGLLLLVLRKILRNTAGSPQRRAAHLSGLAFTLFLVWSVSRVVP